MSEEKRKKPPVKTVNLKDVTPKIRKQIKTLEERVEYLEKVREEYLSVFPRLDFFLEMRGYYQTLPFIPQDMGFSHQEVTQKGRPVQEVYFKDGIGATKIPSGEWLFTKGTNQMTFAIKNKFEAFMVLRLLGLEFPAQNKISDQKSVL